MSRNAVAAELTELIGQLQGMLQRAERLAQSSGGLVQPKWFAGAIGLMTMAAGDLDEKGLLLRKEEPITPAPEKIE